MNIALPQKLQDFVKSEVESGHYESESEVVEEALHVLREAREFGLERLKKALAEAEADLSAGRYTRITSEKELDEFFSRL